MKAVVSHKKELPVEPTSAGAVDYGIVEAGGTIGVLDFLDAHFNPSLREEDVSRIISRGWPQFGAGRNILEIETRDGLGHHLFQFRCRQEYPRN